MADLNTIGGLHYEMMRRCYNDQSVAYIKKGYKLSDALNEIKHSKV